MSTKPPKVHDCVVDKVFDSVKDDLNKFCDYQPEPGRDLLSKEMNLIIKSIIRHTLNMVLEIQCNTKWNVTGVKKR